MTKPELVNTVAERTGMKKVDVGSMLDAVFESITDTLGKKEQVSIAGFGVFDTRTRAARIGRNPRTGERITIPETTTPVFRAGKRLRSAVAG